jgi:hypothetical protein
MSSGMLRRVVSYKLTDGLEMKHWSISRLNGLTSQKTLIFIPEISSMYSYVFH